CLRRVVLIEVPGPLDVKTPFIQIDVSPLKTGGFGRTQAGPEERVDVGVEWRMRPHLSLCRRPPRAEPGPLLLDPADDAGALVAREGVGLWRLPTRPLQPHEEGAGDPLINHCLVHHRAETAGDDVLDRLWRKLRQQLRLESAHVTRTEISQLEV